MSSSLPRGRQPAHPEIVIRLSASLSTMPRLPPLQVSFEPVPIQTTRRVYIQNLVNLLHHAIRTRNQPQASKAWGILVSALDHFLLLRGAHQLACCKVTQIRCEEVDWKTSWKWALPVFDLEIDAARRTEAGSSTQSRGREPEEVTDIWQRKEKYLRRLLVSVSLIHVSTCRIHVDMFPDDHVYTASRGPSYFGASPDRDARVSTCTRRPRAASPIHASSATNH